METKVILITQARLGSTRLPGKILKKIGQKSIIQIHLERLQKSKNVNKIIVATTNKKEDDIVFNNVLKFGVCCKRGSELDVLDRYYQAAKDENAEWIVRVTSDCPLIDPELIDSVISIVINNNKDYGSNTLIENFPDGQDVEVFKFQALETAWKNSKLNSEREHVTTYIRNNCDLKGGKIFSAINIPCEFDFSQIRMTVDEIQDLNLVQILVENLGDDKKWIEYTRYIIENKLSEINGNIIRNEGLLKSLKKEL